METFSKDAFHQTKKMLFVSGFAVIFLTNRIIATEGDFGDGGVKVNSWLHHWLSKV